MGNDGRNGVDKTLTSLLIFCHVDTFFFVFPIMPAVAS
jgi:hypothetical protein